MKRLANKQLQLFAPAAPSGRIARRLAGKGKPRARLADNPAVHKYLSAIGKKGAAATNAKRTKAKRRRK